MVNLIFVVSFPLPLVPVSSLITTSIPELFIPNFTITLIVCTFAIVASILVAVTACYLCSRQPSPPPSMPIRVVWIKKSTSSRRPFVKRLKKRRQRMKRPTTDGRQYRAMHRKPRAIIRHQRPQRLRVKQQKRRRRAKYPKPKVHRSDETSAIREMVAAASISESGEHIADTNHLICAGHMERTMPVNNSPLDAHSLICDDDVMECTAPIQNNPLDEHSLISADDVMEQTTRINNSPFVTAGKLVKNSPFRTGPNQTDNYSVITSKRSILLTPKPEEDGTSIGQRPKFMPGS